jgi:hypothetical protein
MGACDGDVAIARSSGESAPDARDGGEMGVA